MIVLSVPTEQDPFPPLFVFVTFTSRTRVVLVGTKIPVPEPVIVTAFSADSTEALVPEKVIRLVLGFAMVTPVVAVAASDRPSVLLS